MSSVYAMGVFDLIHPGHFNLLYECRMIAGDGKLTVAVCSDELCQKTKGPTVWREDFRLKMISLLKLVDDAFIYRDLDQSEHIRNVRPEIVIVSPDYGVCEGHKRTISCAEGIGSRIIVLPRTDGISTTYLKENSIGKVRNSP